ncbi:MAG TPA: type VI secretion system membrane subunit TssM [Caulobacteraceae bacterium]|jgi:type VI secretion system protein ImpL
MGTLKKIFASWWFWSSLVAILLILVLAVLLPLVVAPMRPLGMRLLLTAVVAGVWLAISAWIVISARMKSDRMAKELAAQTPTGAESAAVAERMKAALAGLKNASGNRRDYLYSRPWYIIIGPPGAGKTTALVNSGLRFPFSETALKGVGGTRNLDFWFADEAVLVDTAGRYTTQDSDAERDGSAWQSFLKLLKTNRPQQPVNGVLIAIGLDEIAGAGVAKIDNHAAIVRRRLQELQTSLESVVPVYVMFTKADLIAGFAEFYDDLDVEGRRAVLGSTFPWSQTNKLQASDYAAAFDGVAQAVADRASKRLQEELDARRRSLVVGFPGQLSALRSRVVRFLDGAFPADAPQQVLPLRGFYLTSGVQQGTPLDRLLEGVASVYDAPARPAAAGQGRAYFLNRLLNDVVIAEAGLVQMSAAARRRRATQAAIGVAAVAVVSVVLLVLWTVSFMANRSFQNRLAQGAQNSTQQARADTLDLVEVRESDPDLEAELSFLRGLRNLPRGYAERTKGPPLSMGFGLYQAGLSRQASQTYEEALERVMLPRVLLRLERYMRDNSANALALYQPLKSYLTLGGQAPEFDRKAVKAWVEADWAQNVYPGEERAALRKELGEHLDALLDDKQFGGVWPDRKAPLDGAVIESARQSIQTLSLADRAYAVLQQEAQSSGQQDWRVDSILSSGDAKAFANGPAVLAERVPYFYTKKGFEQGYQIGLQNVQIELEKDLWVLGGDKDKESIRAQMAQVRPGVARLYAQDYVKAWQNVISSLQPADYFTDPAAFGAATGSPSPMKLILLEVRKNTNFAGGTKVDAAAGALAKAIPPGLAAAAGGDAPTVDAGQVITAAFQQTAAFVGDGKAPAPIDDFTAKLKAAVVAKGAADRAGGLGGADAAQATLNTAMSELSTAALTAPATVQPFAAAASKQGDKAQISSTQGAVSGGYTTLASACQSVTQDRYPFVTASTNDAPVVDLLRVFGMGGQLEGYTNQQLRPMMDTTGPIWRWRADSPIAAGFDPTSAGQFQKAASIRDLLAGGLTLKIDGDGFGGAITAAEISAGGQTYRFDAGQAGQRTLQWTASGVPEAHVTLYAGATKQRDYTFQGPWALFRLIDAAKKENAGPMAIKATFGEGASYATFKITLPSIDNPFSRGGPWSFRCPPKL